MAHHLETIFSPYHWTPTMTLPRGSAHHEPHHDSVRRFFTDDGKTIEIRTHYEIIIGGDTGPRHVAE